MNLDVKELKQQMVKVIEEANTPEQINFLINARQKIVEANNLKEKYIMRLAALRGVSKEKIVADDVEGIEINFKNRKKIESEMLELENLLSSIDRELLPQLNESVREATNKIYGVISVGVYPVKKKLQTHIDSLLDEVCRIKKSFEAAVQLLRSDPKFSAIIHKEELINLKEMDFSRCPKGFFDR
jgi:hypothetical protein